MRLSNPPASLADRIALIHKLEAKVIGAALPQPI
jgi:hypothetical protein